MKTQFRKTTITSALIISIMMPAFVSAAPSAGIKPSSFFYFFDVVTERVNLFFTFSPEKKARKALKYADERLAEIEAIAEEKDPDAVKAAIADYENNVALATEKSKGVKDKGQAENLLASIQDNASKNQEALTAVLIKVPEEARAAITQAIEVSKKGQEEAAKQIAELKSEVERLKQEVAELKVKDEEQKKIVEELNKQKSETKPTLKPATSPQAKIKTAEQASEVQKISTITLPSGAVVEINAKGDIIRTIKEAPVTSQTQGQPMPTAPTVVIVQPLTPPIIQILSVKVTPTRSSVRIEWQTNVPAKSKIFLLDNAFDSIFGLSTRHEINITGLISGTTYSYEIESIGGDGQVIKKTASFATEPDIFAIYVSPNTWSVPADGLHGIIFTVETFKNGQYQKPQPANPTVLVITPDGNQYQISNSFTYYPKTVGTHTLVFSFNNATRNVDIEATK